MAQHAIIKEVRQKESTGDFTPPISLGAEQRFISASLNSHNNNLEEQIILGTDCQSVFWEEETEEQGLLQYMTKKFYNGDLSTLSNDGYYILFSVNYTEAKTSTNFFFENNGLYLPEYEYSQANFDQSSVLFDDSAIYSFDEENGILKINPQYRLLEREVLCLRTEISNTSDNQINSDIVISEKLITQKIDDETNKIYVQESIINHLGE